MSAAFNDARPARRNRAAMWAALVTGIVLLSWLVAVPAVWDAEMRRAVAGAHLVHPAAYLIIAPVCDVMDALTLLSVSQTLTLIASLAVLYVAWRATRRQKRGWLGEIGAALVALLALVAFYAAGILLPRPMAALALADPDAVTVDFHSHTNFSHDARHSFDVHANRAWHQAAGFDVAYITDHQNFTGAAEGLRLDPTRAGERLVSLSGIEFVANHDHLNALGVSRTDSTWFTAGMPHLSFDSRPGAEGIPAPVLVQTIPENLSRVPAPDATGRGGVLAIELSDGAPRGIEQSERDRALILRIADSLNLAVVAGSDNHGWGRTAVAWSVLRIPGWRAITPDSLGRAIEGRIRTARRHAAQVIARRSPDPGGSRLALAATLPAVVWMMFTTLSPSERASWIVWAWLLAGLTALTAPRPRTRSARLP